MSWTATDHLRDIAESMGLDTSWSENAWPNFLSIFRNYMIYREEPDCLHSEAISKLAIGSKHPWSDIFFELWRVIMDEPELWY